MEYKPVNMDYKTPKAIGTPIAYNPSTGFNTNMDKPYGMINRAGSFTNK